MSSEETSSKETLCKETLSIELPPKETNEEEPAADEEPTPKKKKAWSYSKDAQQLIINCHNNLLAEKKRGSISRTARLLGIHRTTVKKFVTEGEPRDPNYDALSAREPFVRIDTKMKNFVRYVIYDFYARKLVPTLEMVFSSIKSKCEGTEYKFPYSKQTLWRLLRTLGFRYCKMENRSAIMESDRIIKMRYQFLTKLQRFRENGFSVLYLDETMYDVGKENSLTSCALEKEAETEEKKIVICHVGGVDGFLHDSLFLCSEEFSESDVDHPHRITEESFEYWFKNKVLPKLPPKSVIVLDSATYHSRVFEELPDKTSKKTDVIQFLKKHNVPIPQPIPMKPVLLDIIKKNNMEKTYALNEMARVYGHQVLRLPPYHGHLNAMEIAWAHMKVTLNSLGNFYTKDHNNLFNLIKKVCHSISIDDWRRYITQVMQEEQKFWQRDHIVNEEMEPLIVTYDEESDDEFFNDCCGIEYYD